MESVMKVGRTFGDGVYRAAGAVARSARRILSAIPLLGVAPPETYDDAESYDDNDTIEAEDVSSNSFCKTIIMNRAVPIGRRTGGKSMGGEEAETAEAAVASDPAHDKSAVSSPTEKEPSDEVVEKASEPKEPEDEPPKKSMTAASSPAEKTEDAITTPEPTPVPIEAHIVEDNEEQPKPAEAEETVEVSQVQAVIDALVEVNSLSKQKANTATTAPSIIERKTSEDILSQFPSSPPPTPIDPSPLQKAQQVAANATALAEALKVPAEAANIAYASSQKISGNTTFTTISTSQPETPSSIAKLSKVTEIPDHGTVSVSHEQTVNASPQADAVSFENEAVFTRTDKSDEATLLAESKDDRSINVLASDSKTIENMPERIDSEEPRESDLVIRTEEGPVPISDEISFEKNPTVVLPGSTVEADEVGDTFLEADTKRDGHKFATTNVESSEGLLVVTDDQTNGSPVIVETLSEPIVPPVQMDERDEDINEKDVPPPLPDSPIPVPKVTSQLLNFISTQIEDSSDMPEIIGDMMTLATPLEEVPRLEPMRSSEASETSEVTDKIVEIDESPSHVDDPPEKSMSRVEELTEAEIDQRSQSSENYADLPILEPQENLQETLSPSVPLDDDVRATKNQADLTIAKPSSPTPVLPDPQMPTEITTLLLTPPRSPSSNINIVEAENLCDTPAKESTSLFELNDDQSNREFKMESLEQSLNSYNDSELELKERLAESMEENEIVNLELTNNDIEESDQNKTEPQAIVENDVVPNDVGTTKVNDEAPEGPPPAVPAEAPAQILGPAITEDVASVIKAIEEIGINEKAVAAAVNENMESVNTNEILADTIHQNNMNE